MVLPFFLRSKRPVDVEVTRCPLDNDLLDKGAEELPARVQIGVPVDGIQELVQERVSPFRLQPIGNLVDGQAALVEVEQARGVGVNLIEPAHDGRFGLGVPAAFLLGTWTSGGYDRIELLRIRGDVADFLDDFLVKHGDRVAWVPAGGGYDHVLVRLGA